MMSEMKHKREKQWMYKGNKRESVLEEVWWVVRIIREAKVVGVRVWIMTRVAGSEEVDPNDPKFLESMGITRGIPGFQTLQNLVEQDQQENPKSQETIR